MLLTWNDPRSKADRDREGADRIAAHAAAEKTLAELIGDHIIPSGMAHTGCWQDTPMPLRSAGAYTHRCAVRLEFPDDARGRRWITVMTARDSNGVWHACYAVVKRAGEPHEAYLRADMICPRKMWSRIPKIEADEAARYALCDPNVMPTI